MKTILFDVEACNKLMEKFDKALAVAMDITVLLHDLPYHGKIRVLTNWLEFPVVLFLDGDMPMEYSCGIVAEIEEMLKLDEAKVDTYPEIQRLEYRTNYKGYPFYVFSFPRSSCHWVKTGEIETVEKTKLVCA